jgi:diacylglycerol kinase
MAAIFYNVSKTELMAVIIVSALVWSAELFNTAVEKLVDLVSKDFDPRIKFIKDVSAAAVLLSAIAALLTGAIIFIPKLLQ